MSLVNFQPLIDASKESARASQRSQEYRTRAMEQGFQLAGQALGVMGERGRAREKRFQSIFDYDLNKNASKEARGYLADKYRQIKRDGVTMFKENKNLLGYGKLTPEQRIQLDNDLDSFKREAELLNVINSQIGNAEKIESDGSEGIVVNREDVGRYLELLQPKNGNYDTEGMTKFLSDIDKSPTGFPFTDYIEFDPDFYLENSAKPIIKKEIKPTISTDEVTVDRNGKRVTKTYQTKTYGTEGERRDNLYAMLSSSKKQGLYEYRIGESLTDDERQSAIAEYGNKVPNHMSAYYAFNKADLTSGFEDAKILTKEKEAPAPKGRAGAGEEGGFIEKDNGTWKLGTTPISIKTELDGDPISGSIYEIYEDDSGYTFAKISYRNEYGETSIFEKPLEEVYDEVDRALKRYPKGGLQLEDWEEIKFPEKADVAPEAEPIPEFSKKRIALWRSGDKAKYNQAIDFIRENPKDPKAKEVYDVLISKGLIE